MPESDGHTDNESEENIQVDELNKITAFGTVPTSRIRSTPTHVHL